MMPCSQDKPTGREKTCLALLSLCLLPFFQATSQWVPNGIPVCDTTANPLFYMLPKIASDGHGGAFVCWHDYRSADIYVQHVGGDGSMLWQRNGIPLINDSAAQQYPRIINDGSDGAYVAWEDDRSTTDTYAYAQHLDADGHSLWTPGGVKVSDRGGLFISICRSPDDGLLVAWIGGGVEDVVIQKLNRSGSREWGDSGVFLARGPGRVAGNDVVVESDGSGGAIVVWSKSGVIYTQRLDNLGRTLWGSSALRLSDSTRNISVGVSTDKASGAVFSWMSQDQHVAFAQRVRNNGQVAWDSGGIGLGGITGGGNQRHTADGYGGAFVGHGRWIQHIDSSGALLWPAPGAVFTQAANYYVNSSQVVNDSSGIWNFCGQRIDNDYYVDIYGQYIDINGNPRWGSVGLPICRIVDSQDWPRGISVGNGRAIVVWDDFRSPHDSSRYSSVYAALVDTLGSITSVGFGEVDMPEVPTLYQNFPNPFNPTTQITYTLPKSEYVNLTIYDLLGRKVVTLVQGRQSAGTHTVPYMGHGVAGGVYFCTLTTGGHSKTIKMLTIR
jgi:hypothetical protein